MTLRFPVAPMKATLGNLPADELPSVVLHYGEEGTARHQHKIGKRVGPFQAT